MVFLQLTDEEANQVEILLSNALLGDLPDENTRKIIESALEHIIRVSR